MFQVLWIIYIYIYIYIEREREREKSVWGGWLGDNDVKMDQLNTILI